jgi:hypothetical protein
LVVAPRHALYVAVAVEGGDGDPVVVRRQIARQGEGEDLFVCCCVARVRAARIAWARVDVRAGVAAVRSRPRRDVGIERGEGRHVQAARRLPIERATPNDILLT